MENDIEDDDAVYDGGLRFPTLDQRKRSKQTVTEEDRANGQLARDFNDVRSPKHKKKKHKKKSKIRSEHKVIVTLRQTEFYLEF